MRKAAKLYYCETLNPRKACAAARFLQADVDFVRVDLASGEQRSAEFLALNPNGKVPVLQDDAGTYGKRTPSCAGCLTQSQPISGRMTTGRSTCCAG